MTKKKSVPAKTVPALCLAALCVCVPAGTARAADAEDYNPVKALREGRGDAADDRGAFVLPKKTRRDAIALSVAPEYFFAFGSDLPDAEGWGASVGATAHFNSDTPKWDFVGGLELLAFTARSGRYAHGGTEVRETLASANILLQGGLSRELSENFALEAMLGLGLGATYGEVKGDDFKTSSSGNWTTTLSAKILGEYRFDERWSVFAAYRFAYISPSIASKIAHWHNLDLFSQSVELGVRCRF